MSLLVLCCAMTWSAEPVDVVAAVEAKYKTVDVLQANFVQTTHSAAFGEEVQKGDLTLKRPKMMRWRFSDEREFVTDGKTLWVYTKADRQVIRYNDTTDLSPGADTLLQSLDRLSTVFSTKVLPSEPGTHALRLTPKEKDGPFLSVDLTLDADFVVQMLVLHDALLNRTDLVFHDVRLGGDVPDSTFHFEVPPGVEVIMAGNP